MPSGIPDRQAPAVFLFIYWQKNTRISVWLGTMISQSINSGEPICFQTDEMQFFRLLHLPSKEFSLSGCGYLQLCYLKTIDNASDDLAVRRIINVPKRGIGATTLNRVQEYAIQNDLSFYDALKMVFP